MSPTPIAGTTGGFGSLRRALVWIGIYIAANFAGGALSGLFGKTDWGTAVLLVLLSVVALFYVRANGWSRYYGLSRPRSGDSVRVLFYIPLVLMIAVLFVNGVRTDLDPLAVAVIVVTMLCVGFLEELIFRGFLFRALLQKHSLMPAVLIAGATFAFGHIVNLGRGMSPLEQGVQIMDAVAVGVVLTLLFALTGTILPLILFHGLIDIAGNIAAGDAQSDLAINAAVVVMCAVYALYLAARLRRKGEVGLSRETHSAASAVAARR